MWHFNFIEDVEAEYERHSSMEPAGQQYDRGAPALHWDRSKR